MLTPARQEAVDLFGRTMRDILRLSALEEFLKEFAADTTHTKRVWQQRARELS